jgi:hypothetical protein
MNRTYEEGGSPDKIALEVSLEAAVPLWIEKVRGLTEWERRKRRHTCAAFVGAHGDSIMFRTQNPQRTIDGFNRLAEGLALLAYAPGGVTAFGQHWEAA